MICFDQILDEHRTPHLQDTKRINSAHPSSTNFFSFKKQQQQQQQQQRVLISWSRYKEELTVLIEPVTDSFPRNFVHFLLPDSQKTAP